MRRSIPTFVLIAAASGCASVPAQAPSPVASVQLISAGGLPAGSAALIASGDGYRLVGELTGLPAGSHGFHLHAVGRCEAPFSSAGAHLNPGMHEHGNLNPKGPHLGDLQNIAVTADGRGSIDLPLSGTRAELDPVLFDADGTALVVHAAADDYRSDPSGNSGARIACGILHRN